MMCEHVHKTLIELADCMQTDEGLSFTTHCMYPSFEPVRVFIAKYGNGYHVHDGGGALKSAWDHGRSVASIKRIMSRHAAINGINHIDGRLVAKVESMEWLTSAILTIANTSAAAALAAVDLDVEKETTLTERMEDVLLSIFAKQNVHKDFYLSGKSGKQYSFDFAIRGRDRSWIILDAVSPHPSSIAAKYVAFSDTQGGRENISDRYVVYDRDLEDVDAALLQQVASLLPFSALKSGIRGVAD